MDPASDRVVAQAHTDCRHPLKHAVMVCIDNVAQEQGEGAWTGKPSLLQGTSRDVKSSGGSGAGGEPDSASGPPPLKKPKKSGQYLCTGYDLYTTKEPCVMWVHCRNDFYEGPLHTIPPPIRRCAMALVHSRIGRVFYGTVDEAVGGLGFRYKIHTQQGINHHFDVYRGVLEQLCKQLYEA